MSSATDILRRRRKRVSHSAGISAIMRVVVMLATFLFGTLLLAVAVAYANLTVGFPKVEEIESIFGIPGNEAFQPVRIYDRSGEHLIFEAVHEATLNRKWMQILPGGISTIPMHALNATIAILDETYWQNPGYDPQALPGIIAAVVGGQTAGIHSPSITQRLAMAQLLPLAKEAPSPWFDTLRSVILAADLTQRYSKEQILEWYVNSANYGNAVYGIDAASLYYFGKHAEDITLVESIALAAFLKYPDLATSTGVTEIDSYLAEVIDRMIRLGMIDKSDGDAALNTPFELQRVAEPPSILTSGLAVQVWDHMGELLGPYALQRSGLRVITAIEYDLQIQAECAAKTHLERLLGGSLTQIYETLDGSACVAAGFLPTLRPRDVGIDHNVNEVALVVIDPGTGEILSMLGPALGPRPIGSVFQPFIYLTAFAQGYSPGSMVLDVPPTSGDFSPGGGHQASGIEYHGPVRMRTALANDYEAAAIESMNLIGVERVLRTTAPMGVRVSDEGENQYAAAIASGAFEASLLDTTYAYGIFASQGKKVGVSISTKAGTTDRSEIRPLLILGVQDATEHWVYASEIQVQAVLSSQLAYLMVDVLSDESARGSVYRQSGILEIGRPAGVQTGIAVQDQNSWTIGFTPSIVVGVWVGNSEGEKMRDVDSLNGAAPIWHAVIRYATRSVPRDGWSSPPGITHIDVCDPSGLLPTQYCPTVVREVFITGTEPTTHDNLFQPFLVNKETGKLATMTTSLDLVEERVYMIPPPGAEAWADFEGIPSPPSEYDTVYVSTAEVPEVGIESPEPFETLRGEVSIRGNAYPEGMDFYRLQYGRGLNPVRWIQLGQDVPRSVRGGKLGIWDTSGLNGLYTLQLVAVMQDGQIMTSDVYVTVDNIPPVVQLLSPQPGLVIDLDEVQEVVLEADVRDEIQVARVVFYVDGESVAMLEAFPYSIRWSPESEGEHVVQVRAYDEAGNQTKSEMVIFSVID